MALDQAIAYALEEAPSRAADDTHESGTGRAQGRTSGSVAAQAGPLSPREREVLALVAEGKSNREIAAALIVTENTAKYHVAQLLNKLGANSRAEAVAQAVAMGLLTPGSV